MIGYAPAKLAHLLEAEMLRPLSESKRTWLTGRLDTYRETVCLLLGRFRNEGLVSVEPKRIRLLNPDDLRAYAEN